MTSTRRLLIEIDTILNEINRDQHTTKRSLAAPACYALPIIAFAIGYKFHDKVLAAPLHLMSMGAKLIK